MFRLKDYLIIKIDQMELQTLFRRKGAGEPFLISIKLIILVSSSFFQDELMSHPLFRKL